MCKESWVLPTPPILYTIILPTALTGSARRAQGSPPTKAQWLKKEKTLTLGSKPEVAEEENVKVDGGVDG
jgi:hypothetical protein